MSVFVVANQAKLQFKILIRKSMPVNNYGRTRFKTVDIGAPDIVDPGNGQIVKYIWKDFPVDKYSSYRVEYKIDLYGDGKIKIPGRYDRDGWSEEWL